MGIISTVEHQAILMQAIGARLTLGLKLVKPTPILALSLPIRLQFPARKS
jgi:hypothetical protein